jgi:hypothetical protein
MHGLMLWLCYVMFMCTASLGKLLISFAACFTKGTDSFLRLQDTEPDVVADSGAEAGHIISTTVRGRNGLPKQVEAILHPSLQSITFHCEA